MGARRHATIAAIEYVLPSYALTTSELAHLFPGSSIEKIDRKTGISARYIAAEGECASDLAAAAAKQLFLSGAIQPSEIDYLLFCTQSPDYFLPTTACILQDRLGIPTTTGALDFNLGCSGYVYGLGIAEGLISSGQASKVLLLTGDTYTKYIHPGDRSVRTLFGDAGAATLLVGMDSDEPLLGPFIYGTDGSGAQNLIVPAGASRQPRSQSTAQCKTDTQGNTRSAENLFMDGPEIFNFTLDVIPVCIQKLLDKSGVPQEHVDLFVFHQANQYMLDHLRQKLRIPPEKFCLALKDCGNTVSSTIPIALQSVLGSLNPGALIMLVGFGVGYSWGATLWRYPGNLAIGFGESRS